jgi:hypothetical protein
MRLISIALASSLIVASGAAKALTINGSFDGFCDGFALHTNLAGAVFGVETGCLSGTIAGRWVGKFKRGSGGGGAVTSENHLPGPVYEINTSFHTWAIYEPDGSVLQTGTWTPTPQGRANRGLPATGTVPRTHQ